VAGLPMVPRRRVEHRGVTLDELDLDAALARRPTVILVDELAHTNAPGSRHLKRWQDVLELLDAGVEVHTTLNVQHVASLTDVVEQITGVKVRETVPDDVLARADELELIDLAPRGAARAAGRGQGVPARAGAARHPALLPEGQPAGAARAGAAPHRRAGRRRRPGLSPRPRHRPPVGQPRAGAGRGGPEPVVGAADPRRQARRRAPRRGLGGGGGRPPEPAARRARPRSPRGAPAAGRVARRRDRAPARRGRRGGPADPRQAPRRHPRGRRQAHPRPLARPAHRRPGRRADPRVGGDRGPRGGADRPRRTAARGGAGRHARWRHPRRGGAGRSARSPWRR
jgi:hypothetical protein